MAPNKPRHTRGIGALEVVSPELLKALGITRPTQFDPKTMKRIPRGSETPRPFRPQGLFNILLPESKKQSAEARAMLGSGIMGEGVSPGFQQAITGSPIGAPTQSSLFDTLQNIQKQDVDTSQKSDSMQTDDFEELNQARTINNQLQSIEEDVAGIDKSGVQNIIGPEEDVVGIQDEADKTEKENLTAAQEATKTALQEFLRESGKDSGAKEFKDYINEFGEATGLDISGDPDTKQALMSFGLALMQNRAGKGFNLSNILGAVGEAGEAAMPDFRKAVAEAKATRARAGAFALSRKKEDQEKAQKRSQYLIIPKGTGGIQGTLSNLGKGNLANLNSYQLNNLLNNNEFNEQYEVLPFSDKLLESFTKTKEFGEKYVGKYSDFSLFKFLEPFFR